MVNELFVYYKENKVGTLFVTKDKKIAFTYDDNWIKHGFSISPFSLPLTKQIFISNKPYFNGLFGVFNDSFVDSWGELLLERHLLKKGVNYHSLNILDKLSLLGSHTMGGLTYKPSINENIKINNIDLDELQGDIDKLFENSSNENIDTLFALGGSSGGTRPKILTKYQNKNVIIKFHNKKDPLDIAKKEYLYSVYAKKLGINVPYVELIKGKKNDYFLIERFDLYNNERVFTISVSGLLECDYNSPCLDYNDLIKLTNILTNDKNETLEMYRRMVFNVIFDNLDDHSKNFMFIHDDQTKNKYHLSPAFDLTPSTTYFGEHTTSINHKGKNISDEDMLLIAKTNDIDIKKAKSIIELAKALKQEYDKKVKES